MEELFNLMLHADETISRIVAQYGMLTYLILFSIIFVETGLVIVTFFPGDGLLFSAGILAASGELNLAVLLILLIAATVLGNTSNYLIGRFIGQRILKEDTAKKNQYLSKAFDYYEKHGAVAVLLSRLFPFLRSFVPFVTGISKMDIAPFTLYNILGGVMWICLYVLLGYFFGEIPWVKENYGMVLSLMFAFLVFAFLFAFLKALWEMVTKRNRSAP